MIAPALCGLQEGAAIRNRRPKTLGQSIRGVHYEDHFVVVLVFWGFQLHLFDIWTTVLLRMSDYRHAWSDPQIFGMSYFNINVALAVSFLLYSVGIGLQSIRNSCSSPLRRIWEPLAYCVFVVAFSYRLFFLSQNALDDAWYAKATQDEPWDRSGYHLGLILGSADTDVARVLLESREEVVLRLPDTKPRYQVVEVYEYRTRYSGKTRYEAEMFVPYDDLDIFLLNWTSFRTPRDGAPR